MDLITNAIPPAVFYIMWVVGLELTPEDFRRLRRRPTITVAGTVGPLVAFPLVAGLAILALRPAEAVVAGIILIASAPGAPISNLLVHLARGNTALSVALTALASVLGIVTFPLLTQGGFLAYMGERADTGFPLGPMVAQLVLMVALPIGLGMVVRRRWPGFVAARRAGLTRLTLPLVVAIVVGIVYDQRALFVEQIVGVVGIAALITLAMMAIGWGVGSAVRAPYPDRVAFLVEFSARNSAIALMVASTTLGRLDYAVFLVAYFVVQMPVTAVVLTVLTRWGPGRDLARAETASG
jgi:BASS family bile acid:Na+ symporter